MLLDDFSRPDGRSALGTAWRAFTDQVMGGVSTQSVGRETVEGEPALRLRGEVRLDNNGGFVQVALDLGGPRDASAFEGLRLRVRGNGERYAVHLRSRDTRLPWQYYEAAFTAGPQWSEVELPFDDFAPQALRTPLDRRALLSVGIVVFEASLPGRRCRLEDRALLSAVARHPPQLPAQQPVVDGQQDERDAQAHEQPAWPGGEADRNEAEAGQQAQGALVPRQAERRRGRPRAPPRTPPGPPRRCPPRACGRAPARRGARRAAAPRRRPGRGRCPGPRPRPRGRAPRGPGTRSRPTPGRARGPGSALSRGW